MDTDAEGGAPARYEGCEVCGAPVQVASDAPADEPVLCIEHYFTDDPTEDWESE